MSRYSANQGTNYFFERQWFVWITTVSKPKEAVSGEKSIFKTFNFESKLNLKRILNIFGKYVDLTAEYLIIVF